MRTIKLLAVGADVWVAFAGRRESCAVPTTSLKHEAPAFGLAVSETVVQVPATA